MDQKSTEKIFNDLSADQRKQVESILADKNKTQQILDSPQAKELLKNTNASIMEITQKIGFQNYNYFIQVFKKMVGTTPLKYRSS